MFQFYRNIFLHHFSFKVIFYNFASSLKLDIIYHQLKIIFLKLLKKLMDSYINLPNQPRIDKAKYSNQISKSYLENHIVSTTYQTASQQTFTQQSQSSKNNMGLIANNIQYYDLKDESICPYCGLFCEINSSCLFFDLPKINRKILYHKKCSIQKQNSKYKISNIQEFIEQAKLKENNFPQIIICSQKQDIKLYQIQLLISHPITDMVYFTSTKEIYCNQNTHSFNFIDLNCDYYNPNMICFPYCDFKVTVNIHQQKIKKNTFKFYTNLNRIQKDKIFASIQNGVIQLGFEIFNNEQNKKDIIQKLNYKYNFSIKKKIVRLNSLKINFLEVFKKSIQMQSNQIEFTPQKEINYFNQPQYNSFYTQGYNQFLTVWNQQMIVQSAFYPNFRYQFQRLLKNFDNYHIQHFFHSLFYYFPELIVHQHGNYIFQDLVKYLNSNQRLELIHYLQENLIQLIRDHRGTICLQQLAKCISTDQQQQLFYNIIQKQFIQLSNQEKPSYFIQCLIQNLKIQLTILLLYKLFEQKTFIQQCKNCHGVRIIKKIMKKLYQSNKQHHTNIKQIIEVIEMIAYNLEHIMNDMYGNYVVQYAFQLYQEKNCLPIISRISLKFVPYSLQKISSKVVEKFLNFKNLKIQELLSTLQGSGIDQMLKNPVASIILKKLIQNFTHVKLIDLIQRALKYQRNSKFANEWKNIIVPLIQKAETQKNHKRKQESFSQAHKKQGYRTPSHKFK